MAKPEVYTAKDDLIGNVSLGNPVKIRIEIDKDSVFLTIGPRDISWTRGKKESTGSGYSFMAATETQIGRYDSSKRNESAKPKDLVGKNNRVTKAIRRKAK